MYDFLFNTRTGMIILILGGIALCVLIAWLLEKRTRQMYKNHPKTANDDDEGFAGLFNSDDDDDSDNSSDGGSTSKKKSGSSDDDEDFDPLGGLFAGLRKEMDEWDPDADGDDDDEDENK